MRVPGVDQRCAAAGCCWLVSAPLQLSHWSTTGRCAQHSGQSLVGSASTPADIFHADDVDVHDGQPGCCCCRCCCCCCLTSRTLGAPSLPPRSSSSSSSLATDRSRFLARHASSTTADESGDRRQRVLVAVESPPVVATSRDRLYLNDRL